MDDKKIELFLETVDKALMMNFCMLVSNGTIEGGFTNEWQRIVDAMNLIAKHLRQLIRGLRVAIKMRVILEEVWRTLIAPKLIQTPLYFVQELIGGYNPPLGHENASIPIEEDTSLS